MDCRLLRQKKLYWSKGERITLLKSKILSFPTYSLSPCYHSYLCGKQIGQITEKMFVGLLGRGVQIPFGEVRNIVCLPIFTGGLGVRKIGTFNQAFFRE